MSIDKRMDKENLTHIHTKTLSHKKNEILPLVSTWMDLKVIMLSEISQMEEDKYYIISLICGIFKKKKSSKIQRTDHLLVVAQVESGLSVLVTQSYPTLCDPMDCSPSGSSVHEILQARLLEWVAISFSRRAG